MICKECNKNETEHYSCLCEECYNTIETFDKPRIDNIKSKAKINSINELLEIALFLTDVETPTQKDNMSIANRIKFELNVLEEVV